MISLRPSEVQSSGMAVASLCLVPRYTVLSVVPGPLYSADGNRRGDPRSIFPQNVEPRLHGSGGFLDRSHFGLDCFFHGVSSRIRDEVLSGPICADYCDSFNDGAIVSMLTYFSDAKHRSGCGFSMMRGYLRMRGVEIVPFFLI